MQIYGFIADTQPPPQTPTFSSSPIRTYNNTYVTDSAYVQAHIVNRLLSSTVKDASGNTTTLGTYRYDGVTPTDVPGIRQHDANYNTSFLTRSNQVAATTLTAATSRSFDIGGSVTWTSTNGVQTTVTQDSTKNWAAPSAMTTNSLTTAMNWSSFLGLTQDTGPNGDSTSINYDATARPQTTTSPYGATTSYTYNDTASPPTKVVTTNGHWTKTTMDGFGRTIQVDTGYGSTTVYSVQTQYAACGCSPLGKVYRVSRPYQGSPSAWTTYS